MEENLLKALYIALILAFIAAVMASVATQMGIKNKRALSIFCAVFLFAVSPFIALVFMGLVLSDNRVVDIMLLCFCVGCFVAFFVSNVKKRRVGKAIMDLIALFAVVMAKLSFNFYFSIIGFLKKYLEQDTYLKIREIARHCFVYGSSIYLGLELLYRIVTVVLITMSALKAIFSLAKVEEVTDVADDIYYAELQQDSSDPYVSGKLFLKYERLLN